MLKNSPNVLFVFFEDLLKVNVLKYINQKNLNSKSMFIAGLYKITCTHKNVILGCEM